MNDIKDKNILAMSDAALIQRIGGFVKHHRLEQNLSQDRVAHDAGISRSTLSLLERGETVTVATLLQVLRVLKQLYVLDNFLVQDKISPIKLMQLQQAKRKRSSSSAYKRLKAKKKGEEGSDAVNVW